MPRTVRNINPGDRFGFWTVISPTEIINGRTEYNCQCSCGAVKVVSKEALYLKKSTKCRACSDRQRRVKYKSAVYKYRLGGRGITTSVDSEWDE